jgi:N-acetylmuramoyl-L-alanine amidase
MKSAFIFISILASFFANGQAPEKYFLGRTTGPLPYLEYGLGEDRLGGAKMTYLDSNVMVRVIDSVKDRYKIRLSTNHVAYLPKLNFKPDTVRLKPYYLTDSWKAYGDSAYDYVTINLPERLPYNSLQQIDPAKIVVDIFGATTNTNWITQLKTQKEIKNAWYEQIEDDVFRVYIELRHQQHWGYSIYYNNNFLTIRVKRQPQKLSITNLVIAIDAGHGGANTGTSGVHSNVIEKEYTLKMAKELEKYLHAKKIRTVMTRTEDSDITMIDRTLMLREKAPDLLVSIHLNSSGNPSVSGVSTYYRYIGFRTLSQSILNSMLTLGLDEYGNIGAFNFSLSGPTDYPNCLVEVAFLTNPGDEKRVLTPRFQKDVAKKIYDGIVDWLKQMKN